MEADDDVSNTADVPLSITALDAVMDEIGDIPEPRPTLWHWDVFGVHMHNGIPIHLMHVSTPFEIPWWRRTLCRIFLGSTFTRVTHAD